MTSATPSTNDYHIGIITALSIERAAVVAMLDARHKKPDDFNQSRDPNSYTWGRIGSHNVAVASLASGAYGNTMATTTAVHMLYSFPNIKFGLMVGIGAGVPNARDIRLGDVVVSQPSGLSNGVFQYDLGKAKYNEWERRDFLARPPEVLLKALGNLQAEHEFGLYQAHDYFQDAVHRHGHWANSYGYPQAQDRLFSASYLHQTDLLSNDCSKCDAAQIVGRAQRESPTQFQIHYGVIASGNSLVKDAELRDKIAAMDDQCICIEMEAAGLMNDFPCLVIRGISDYADSHKNDAWQRYASATAAAFTKELLGFVPTMGFSKAVESTKIVPTRQEVEDETKINISSIHITSKSEETQDVKPEVITKSVNDRLREAIMEKDLDMFHNLLSQGADPNSTSGWDKDTGLHIAARNGDYEMLEVLLDNSANIEAKNNDGSTPLHIATRHEWTDATLLLLRKGAAIEASDNQGRTPLHWAAIQGNPKVMHLLIDLGGDIEAADKEKFRPVHVAVCNSHLQVTKLLIDRKADIEAACAKGKRALHLAVDQGLLEVTKLLLDHGADVNAANDSGERAVHSAVRQGHLEVTKLLLDHKADIEVAEKDNHRPIHFAILRNYLDIAKLLIDHKANIEAVQKFGWRPLHLATQSGKLPMIRLLIDHKADVNAKDGYGNMPIWQTFARGNDEATKLLINYQADIGAMNQEGDTSMFEAVDSRNKEIITLLLDRGANIDIRNDSMRTPLLYAIAKGKPDMAMFLIARGANVNAADESGTTALHLTARFGNLEITKMLVERGASKTAKDWSDKTPLDRAKSRYVPEVTDFLIGTTDAGV